MIKEELEKNIFQLLKKIAPETEPSELSPTENIREALGIDSYDFLQFIIALDEKLKIEIPEQDYGKITSLNSLTDYLINKPK
ncbi:acyl carrier protein [Daejeonella rubra]|uniref:Acyl carrier protein n=1 Tax=Daejeonella rubra TaxID=990371 RepID=A0A1G9YLX0_9SPHI|nr:phosphopantetheine-binding protein [Daejeonella rubra]SDN10017.1 acyl carrier protein [Daejeonella rubra]